MGDDQRRLGHGGRSGRYDAWRDRALELLSGRVDGQPQPVEVARLRPHHTLFTYLHLAPDDALTQGLCDSGATCIAYETITDRAGRLPLLAPMSEVAGRLAPQVGSYHLMRSKGGRGVLMGGVPGVRPADVVVLGGGVDELGVGAAPGVVEEADGEVVRAVGPTVSATSSGRKKTSASAFIPPFLTKPKLSASTGRVPARRR